jgi:hypothetical protein
VSKIKGVALANHGIGAQRTALGENYPWALYKDRWYHPTAPDDNGLVTTVALPSAGGGADATIVGTGTPDFPRNVTIIADAAQTSICTITGINHKTGLSDTEALTFNGTNEVAGAKAWDLVTKVHFAVRSGAANAIVGWGSVLGLSRLPDGMIAQGAVDAAHESTDPGVNPTNQTCGFNTSLANTKVYEILYSSSVTR